jgi:hypothetical protein
MTNLEEALGRVSNADRRAAIDEPVFAIDYVVRCPNPAHGELGVFRSGAEAQVCGDAHLEALHP